MKVIGRYQGILGEIRVWEREADGSRYYVEGDVFQSHGTPEGDSQFTYVKMMEAFLLETTDVLVLGCGGGNLATMLARSGKRVTVVDHNPTSIDIAREFFGMPKEIPCIIEDFRSYVSSEIRRFDGIAVDVGGPGFCFEEQFDESTCSEIKGMLLPGGRIIMNMLVGDDLDPAADKIANALSDGKLIVWIFDQPGFVNRNALIACLPKGESAENGDSLAESVVWKPRRPRHWSRTRRTIKIDIKCPG